MIQRYKDTKIQIINTSRFSVRYSIFGIQSFLFTIRIITGIFIIAIVSSCTTSGNRINTKTITVSILPQKYFVDRITGNTFEVNVMVPPGASPATYEPTARQMTLLGSSLVYLKVGYIEFEKIWINNIKSTNNWSIMLKDGNFYKGNSTLDEAKLYYN